MNNNCFNKKVLFKKKIVDGYILKLDMQRQKELKLYQ